MDNDEHRGSLNTDDADLTVGQVRELLAAAWKLLGRIRSGDVWRLAQCVAPERPEAWSRALCRAVLECAEVNYGESWGTCLVAGQETYWEACNGELETWCLLSRADEESQRYVGWAKSGELEASQREPHVPLQP